MAKTGELLALQILYNAAQTIQMIENIRDEKIKTLLLTSMANEIQNGIVAKMSKKKRS